MAILSNADVANKVRGVAAEKRVTQAELAFALSMTEMAMSRRMKGQTPFSPEELSRMADVLSTPVSTFFGEYTNARVGAA